MMPIERFEDIIAWQKSKTLAVTIYKTFNSLKDWGFKDQIFRAAVSVMNNIAEGYERRGDKEFKRFLFIAKGSCAETRSMLYLALELNYCSRKEFDNLFNLAEEINKVLSGFIKKLD